MMEKRELEKRLETALSASDEAGRYLISHEEMRRSVLSKGENDYVTSADKRSEDIIHKVLLEAFPSDGWYGEESGKAGNSDRRWIVDPIDGTVDFMWSFPLYTISIAYEDEDGIALGVVSLPRQKEVFYAIRGEGAFLNGKRIYTDENIDIKRSLALLVPPHRVHDALDDYIVRMRRFYDHFSDMRSIGSAACSLSYVASGRCSIYYEEYLHIYDIAAGMLILKEAGGRVSLKEDGDYVSILASNNQVHSLGLELIDGKGSYI